MTQDTFASWSATASNNTSITGDAAALDISEGWPAANVNNAFRAMMAACVLAHGDFPRGTSKPSYVTNGKFWIDTTTAASPILKYYDGTDNITVLTVNTTANTVTFNGTVSGALANIVEDTTPQLGGNLDVNSNSIVSASAGNIVLEPDTTGQIALNAAIVTVEDDIVHAGDTNNLISFGTDTQSYETGGTSRLDISDSGVRLGAANARVTTILDEDTMSSDSATALATQQSIKAYVDANASGWTVGTALTPTGVATSDFTSLPSGIEKIEITLAGISTGGSSGLRLEVGHSAGTFQTSGYFSGASNDSSQANDTTAFAIVNASAASDTASGVLTLSKVQDSTDTWALSGCVISATGSSISFCAGHVVMAAELDAVRLTTLGGVALFDAGTWNIKYWTA